MLIPRDRVVLSTQMALNTALLGFLIPIISRSLAIFSRFIVVFKHYFWVRYFIWIIMNIWYLFSDSVINERQSSSFICWIIRSDAQVGPYFDLCLILSINLSIYLWLFVWITATCFILLTSGDFFGEYGFYYWGL